MIDESTILNGQLTPAHLAELAASAITPDIAIEAGLRSVGRSEAESIGGFDCGPALAFTYIDVANPGGPACLTRLKPDTPYRYTDSETGKTRSMKYVSPKRSRNRLYIPQPLIDADTLNDTKQRLVITEGEKKALSATYLAHVPTIAVPGVYNWMHKGGPIADLDYVVWAGREVAVMFDSDGATNRNVESAGRRLVEELRSRGAIATLSFCPAPAGDERVRWKRFGIDDLIVARGAPAFEDTVSRSVRVLGWKTAAEALREPHIPPSWLVRELIPEGSCGFLAGEPKTCKSWLALHLALCVATGKSFLGRDVIPGSAAIVQEEMNEQALLDRLSRLALGHDIPDGWQKRITICQRAQLQIDSQGGLSDFKVFLQHAKPALVILDPLNYLHRAEENSASELGKVLVDLRRAKDEASPKSTLILVHHLRKQTDRRVRPGQRMRGSSALHGWTDVSVFTQGPDADGWISLEAEGRELIPDEATLPCFRLAGGRGEPIRLETVPHDEYERMRSERKQSASSQRLIGDAEAIAAHLAEHGETPKKRLQEGTGLSGKRFQTALKSLTDEGKVRVTTGKSTGGRPAELITLVSDEEGTA